MGWVDGFKLFSLRKQTNLEKIKDTVFVGKNHMERRFVSWGIYVVGIYLLQPYAMKKKTENWPDRMLFTLFIRVIW